MAIVLSPKGFAELLQPGLKKLFDYEYGSVTSYHLGKTPTPDDMQSLYDLADETKHGD